jgi:hypothetical protein
MLSVGICCRAIRSPPAFRRNVLSLSSGHNLCVTVHKMAKVNGKVVPMLN